MARKLWSAEEMDLDTGAELEVGPEAGEASDVLVDVKADTTDVAADADNIDAGMAATDDVQDVVDLVEDQGEEGITPVAAESLKIALEIIARNVGANPTSLYALYATENYATPESSKRNIGYATEGAKEFLQDLWKRIKAAVTNLWNKMKAFWNKHVSNIGRLKKAVEAMKAKVRSSSGKFSGKPYLDKAPGSVAAYYKGTGDITANEVQESLPDESDIVDLTAGVDAANKSLDDVIAKVGNNINDATKANEALSKAIARAGKKSASVPIVGGAELVIEVELDWEDGSYEVTIEREPIDNTEDDRGMVVADKATLSNLLNGAQKTVNALVKLQKDSEKRVQTQNEMFVKFEKLIAGGTGKLDSAQQAATGLAQGDTSAARKVMRVFYKAATASAKVDATIVAEYIKAIKAALVFSGVCVKQYA